MGNFNSVFVTEDTTLEALFRSHGSSKRLDPGATIVAQGQGQDHVYRILRGCVRSCVYARNGKRSVIQFQGPGDILGLGTTPDWSASHEAVDVVVLESMPRSVFEAAVTARPSVQRDIRERLALQIEKHAALLVLTSNSSAVARVRAFLWEFARHRPEGGFVCLPMGRRDIADHLGISMETVSRSISELRNNGEIALDGASFFRFLEPERKKIPHAA